VAITDGGWMTGKPEVIPGSPAPDFPLADNSRVIARRLEIEKAEYGRFYVCVYFRARYALASTSSGRCVSA
jgi:hypothetical protein